MAKPIIPPSTLLTIAQNCFVFTCFHMENTTINSYVGTVQ